MKHHSRTPLRYGSLLILALLLLAGMNGSQLAKPAAAMMPAVDAAQVAAAPTSAPATQPPVANPATPKTLTQANVPVIKLPAMSPGSSPGTAGSAVASAAPDQVYHISFDKSGVQPMPDVASAQRATQQAAQRGGSTQPQPNVGALGSSNAYMSISPDTARPSTPAATAIIVTGFQPYEIVIFSFSGGNNAYFQANADGAAFAIADTGGGVGNVWIQAVGLYSGHFAGGVMMITQYAAPVPGLAVAPHAVRNGDRLYMLGVRYPANSSLTVQRNSTSIGSSYPVDNQGITQLISVVVNAAQDGAAVYSAYTSITPIGSLAGQSIEERADAGPVAPTGDRNTARAVIDRPVLSDTVATTIGLIGEGFQVGETVNFVRQPGNGLGSAVADSSGAVSFLVLVPPGDNTYNISLTGATTARVGYAAVLVDSRALNVPSVIVSPAHSPSTANPGTLNMLFTRFTPNTSGAIWIDGQLQGSLTTSSGGFGSIQFNQPTYYPLVHSYTFSETFGLNASSGTLILPNTGTVVGTVKDAVSGLPIKATIRADGISNTDVQSDPNNNGSYTTTLIAVNHTLRVSAGGCYVDQDVPVTVLRNSVVSANVTLQRSPIDNVGYQCYQNAGRAYVAAANRVFSNNFNEAAAQFAMPFSINWYNQQVMTGTLSTNGYATIGFQFTCPDPNNCNPNNGGLPNTGTYPNFLAVDWDDLAGYANDPSSGVYTGVVGTAPNRTFLIEWRNFTHYTDSANIINTAELQIDEATSSIYYVYPNFNVGRSDGRESTIGINSTDGRTGKVQQALSCNGPNGDCEPYNWIWAGDSIRFYKSQNPTATPTPSNTPSPTITLSPTITPTPTNTGTPLPEGCRTDGNYSQSVTTGATVVPGTTDIGNHGDNVITNISLPFTYTYYGQQFTSANVSSNGTLQFSSNNSDPNNVCLGVGWFNNTIFPYWDDLRTDGTGVGVYTSVSGSAPNRIFNVEWRTCIWTASACSSMDTQFEVRLYEGQQKLDMVYGTSSQIGHNATSGLQRDGGSLVRTYSCNNTLLMPGLKLSYVQNPCATPTITSTPTITPTPTNTATITPIPTIRQGSATPTPVLICDGGTVSFASVMNSSNVVPSNNSPATGTGSFSLAPNGTMTYNITFQNLVASETAAEIHDGVPGTNGALIFALPLGAHISGSFAFPSGYLTDLNNGRVYIVINTTAFPNGEIRDQLNPLCNGTATPTQIGGATNTPTQIGGATATPTQVGGATATPCAITFSDVPQSAYYYTPVEYLACHGVISGYSDGTFRPSNNTTRGQMTKIVALGFSVPSYTPPGGNYTFTDVTPGSTFFNNIETAAHASIVNGYPCGTKSSEPCDSANRPYYRPSTNVTRGQLTKIVVGAAGWALINPANNTFTDVVPGSTFYQYIETAVCRGIINGYACGSATEPCDSQNRPYFEPGHSALRGQISKIVYNAITSTAPCVVP